MTSTAVVPDRILNTMLANLAVATAHGKLCDPTGPTSGSLMARHPGDGFGRVLGWLWSSGHSIQASILVADYLAQMRNHNVNVPDAGERLTWPGLRATLPFAIENLTASQIEELVSHLDATVPGLYGDGIDVP